jgi:acetoacetyl-CoA synthetase
VKHVSSALRDLGVRPGDRVASFAANNAEMVVAFVSAATIGAVYSCSPVEFGVNAVVDRFTQVGYKLV